MGILRVEQVWGRLCGGVNIYKGTRPTIRSSFCDLEREKDEFSLPAFLSNVPFDQTVFFLSDGFFFFFAFVHPLSAHLSSTSSYDYAFLLDAAQRKGRHT